MPTRYFEAEPYSLEFSPDRLALIIIDMQRDFLEPSGFGKLLGNDVSPLRAAIAPGARVLAAARRSRITVIHAREGHRPDLADELRLKRDAARRGQIVMRPDCGSAILDRIPLGFANVVRRGNIGGGAASGTGLQEATSAVHRLRAGITHAPLQCFTGAVRALLVSLPAAP